MDIHLTTITEETFLNILGEVWKFMRAFQQNENDFGLISLHFELFCSNWILNSFEDNFFTFWAYKIYIVYT